ncbi:MAG: hypothetical protein ACP5RH_13405 [Leptodesmis sp.]|uniref:hypothetical protein n=1 Tax=Leptodesmis sp. TaxID=3100501 RepID=UPI003D108C56
MTQGQLIQNRQSKIQNGMNSRRSAFQIWKKTYGGWRVLFWAIALQKLTKISLHSPILA